MNQHMTKKRILLVDDDPLSAETLAHVLVRHGCRVALAATCEDALEHLANEPFDAVLCQLEMRETTGWILLGRIRPQHPHLPVIFVTASYDAGKWASALVWGARALLKTPLREAELTATLALVAHKDAVPDTVAPEPVFAEAGR